MVTVLFSSSTCRYVLGVNETENKEEEDLILEVCNMCQCSYEQRLHFINQVSQYPWLSEELVKVYQGYGTIRYPHVPAVPFLAGHPAF